MNLYERVKGWIMSIFNITKQVVPDSILQKSYYDEYIQNWKNRYYADDKQVTFTNADGTTRSRKKSSMRFSKVVCEEFASLVFSENVKIEIEENEAYTEYVMNVLDQNNFQLQKLELIEKMFALGGSVDKLYTKNNETIIDYVEADKFIATEWNNKRITSGMFLTESIKKDYVYMLIENHTFKNNTIAIEYKLYKCKKNEYNTGDYKGIEVPISELYPDLQPLTIIENVSQPFFSYCRPAIANNKDFHVPLGISIFENAKDTLDSLDEAFDSWQREFKLGKKRIVIPDYATKSYTDANGRKKSYFDPDEDVFQPMNLDPNEKMQIKDDTQILRIEEHVKTINSLLDILCLQLGLSQGTISFDSATGLKTATEVISENSKTFKTKKKHEINLKQNIKDIVSGIIQIGQLYDKLPVMDYEIKITFDDSIIIDKETEQQKDFADVTAGNMSKRRYLKKWSGLNDEEIEKELTELSANNNLVL